MSPSTAPAAPAVFFARRAAGEPIELEFLAETPSPGEFRLRLGGPDFSDLAPLVAPTLAGASAVVYRMPPGLLNANYWEPLKPEGVEAVRAKMGGPITREVGEATLLWRSDAIAPGRLLRDGLDVPVELLEGTAFAVRGPDILRLGEAWSATSPKDRFEWIAFGANAGNGSGTSRLDAREDVDSLRLRTPGVTLIYAATGDRKTILVGRDRGVAREAVRAALRGYLARCVGRPVSIPNDIVGDQFLDLAGSGLSTRSDRDFVSKRVAFEFKMWRGQTSWSPPQGSDSFESDPWILAYYDRVAGIWAVAS